MIPVSGADEGSRFDTAVSVLAEYIGYLHSGIDEESEKPEPNVGRIVALKQERDRVLNERHTITPDRVELIDRAIYVYGPFLKLL